MQFLASTFAAATTSGGSLTPDIDITCIGGVALPLLAFTKHAASPANLFGRMSPSQQAALACLVSLGCLKQAFTLLPQNRNESSKVQNERITSALRRVNKILWLRTCLSIRRWLLSAKGNIGKYAAYVGLHSAIASTFFGCTMYPKASNQTIYKMFRLFVGRDIFDAADARSPSMIGEVATIQRALKVTANAFAKLLPFNVATNAVVLVVGAGMSRKLPPRARVLALVKGCLVMNAAVAASCGVYVSVLGAVSRTVAHWEDSNAAVRVSALGASVAMPTVLALVNDVMVQDALAAMFGQWSVQFILRDTYLPPGPLLVSGAYVGSEFAQHGGHNWLMQVVLAAVQKRLKSQTEWAKE
jgi:hypothetical protein